MASNTTNYGLTKPDANEYYNVSVQNENMDRIDETLKANQDKASAAVTGATFGGTAVPQDGTKLEIPMPNAGQVGAVPESRRINGHALTGDVNLTNDDVGAAGISTLTTITLPSSGWAGEDAPYRQTVGVEGAKPEPTVIEVQPAGTATAEQWAAWRSALIRGGGQDAGSITLLADGEKPEIDIAMAARIRGDMT